MSPPILKHSLATAIEHHRAGRLHEAAQLYRLILNDHPEHLDALHQLAIIAFQSGQYSETVRLLRHALSFNARVPALHNLNGSALFLLNEPAQAVDAFRQAVLLQPDYSEAHYNLGRALATMGEHAEAGNAFRKAIQYKPDFAWAMNDLGSTSRALQQLDVAEKHFRQATEIDPAEPAFWVNLGNTLADLARYDEAIEAYRRAQRLKPNSVEALSGTGHACWKQGKLSEALTAFRAALSIQPRSADLLYSVGTVLSELGNYDQAIDALQRAIKLDPTHARAHHNLGLLLLQKGDFSQGWSEYEWRSRAMPDCGYWREYAQPRWDGTSLQGKRILLHAEQGYGDVFQFARFIPHLAGLGATVLLQAFGSVVRLFNGMPGVEQVYCFEESLPPFDVHCPLPSLPFLLGISSVDKIPSAVPYITAPPSLTTKMRALVQAASGGSKLKVGLCWHGRPHPPGRSIDWAELAPLAGITDITFFKIFKEAETGQGNAETASARINVVDLTGELNDFADTAALIQNLDLVITIDTAVAHLAGAMGVQTWILLKSDPDWRWMRGRQDSPWYPTARLFRQPRRGDWATVVQEVASVLRSLQRRLD